MIICKKKSSSMYVVVVGRMRVRLLVAGSDEVKVVLVGKEKKSKSKSEVVCARNAKTPRRNSRLENKSSCRAKSMGVGQVLLMMTRAPSFPSTPLSFAFGLLSRPFFRERNPSIPDGFSALGFWISEEL